MAARRKLDWSVEVGNEVQVSALDDDPASPVRSGLTPDAAAQAAAYWPLPIVRAVPAVVLALAITFSTGHTAQFGSISFGAFAVTSGLVIAALAYRRLAAASARPFLVAQGVVSVAFGVLALVLQSGGLASFFPVVTGWAAITGALELYAGIRSRRRFIASGDWTIVGAITLAAALAFLVLPPDIADEVTTADGVTGILDSAVVAVGLLGAYGAIIVVFLVIAGFSARWNSRVAGDGTSPADRIAPDTDPSGPAAPDPDAREDAA